MFILYVQIILNNHYGPYFLWQKIGSGGHPCPMDTFLVLIADADDIVIHVLANTIELHAY